MGFEEKLETISVEAGSDLSSSQYRGMQINASGQLAVPSAGGDIDGVLQDKPDAAGVAAAFATGGVSKVEAGGAITAGDELTVAATGKFVTAVTTGDRVHATAMEDASGDGSIIGALLQISKGDFA